MPQDDFLDGTCKAGKNVCIYLTNGIKLEGTLMDFDDHVVMLQASVTQMIYKHAIASIVPMSVTNTNISKFSDASKEAA